MSDNFKELQTKIKLLNDRINVLHEILIKNFDKLEECIDTNRDSLIKILDNIDNIDECLDAKYKQTYRPF